jgi:RNA polymerase sigma-70 factor (ECF subfamily)
MSAETAPALLEAAPAPALAPVERSGDQASPSATAASLYERYHDRVYGYCLYKLGNREEAEDATQTTFLLVLRALERGVVPRLEANWLFTIAQNACRCRARTRGRGREHEVLSDPQVLQEVAPGHNGACEELVGLDEALADMPELQRRAIILREWRGCSYREIAQQLGLTGSAVETLIFRARRSLAQRLEHQTLPSKRRTGTFALDFASLASALKSLLGIGSGAKVAGIAASTAAVVCIGLGGVAGDTAHPASGAATKPVAVTPATVTPAAPAPVAGQPPAPAAEPKSARPTPQAGAPAAPQPAAGPEATLPVQPADLETTLGGITSSLPTAPLVEDVEQRANDLVDEVTAPVTETLKPVVDVKVPKIDLP